MLKWLTRRAAPTAPQPTADPGLATLSFPKFHETYPGPQAALDLVRGRWASQFPEGDEPLVAGAAPHFTLDHRPRQAAAAFGGPDARLERFQVLELGPLEGGHTYQLEGLGAEVLAIEGNAEAYLKCLIGKEILGMRSRFLLGDFVRYLDETERSFDLIFASGVLYHMTNPLRLIELVCRRSARCFLWTHYYDAERCSDFVEHAVEHAGMTVPHFAKRYGDQTHGKFWGGLAGQASWLRADDILQAFRAFGHSRVEVIEQAVDHPYGPCFTVVTAR